MMPDMDSTKALIERLTKPLIGIENRTALEVFDIMSDRIRRAIAEQGEAAQPASQPAHELEGASKMAYHATPQHPKDAEIASLKQELAEARAFVLGFRGIVTVEMVRRALVAYEEQFRYNSELKLEAMRAALMAANVCESCASVADHWSKQFEAAESANKLLRETLTEALDGWADAAQYKGDYLRDKHGDMEEIAQLRALASDQTGGGAGNG